MTNDPLYGRLAVAPKRACHALDIGMTRLYELMGSGELEAYHEGRGRRITVESIRAYREKRLSEARGRSGVPVGVGSADAQQTR